MELKVIEWIAQQGLGAVLAFVMFIIYRNDSKENTKRLSESAATWMAYGKEQGTQLERVGVLLEQIEKHMSAVSFCPVSKVSSEMIHKLVQKGQVNEAYEARKEIEDAIASGLRSRLSRVKINQDG